ncbi:MAG: UbiX family flavin prenyltransferase [Desulfobacterota bacterium]|nr:UbiX family flavin prenyltransferase [Thermodesulfobacteriota bacterium]
MNKRFIVGISGASGAIYGVRLLEALRAFDEIELHLIISKAASYIFENELGASALDKAQGLAHRCYDNDVLAAPIASGSFRTEGMIIAPCSVKTLAAIAHGYGDTLMMRAADVVLKERRKLVLVVRETPLHLEHIENMARVTRMGGVILPPVPAFYHKPRTIDDIVNHTVGKVLDLFNLSHFLYERWGGG